MRVTFESSDLFRGMSPEDLKAVRGIARERQFPAGRDIFREGDEGDGLYLVKDGTIEISGMLADENRHVFSRVGAGDLFGEMAVVEARPRSATAAATQPSSVYFFPRDQILALAGTCPALALNLFRCVSNRLREFNRQYLDEVVQTERLAVIGRFARSIVHDLKNPLNIIGLTAELAMAEGATPEIRRESQRRIRKQVDRISEMVGDILEFTQGGRQSVVLASVEYAGFIQRVVEELRPEAALKSVTIEGAKSAPSSRLMMDPKRLKRVFENLANNAMDAMPRGGAITITCEQKGPQIVTRIADTGPGIPVEISANLFDPFVTFGKAHGTGLGLSICKKIVEDHRGWIKAENSRQGGAVFSIGLPTVSIRS